MPAIHGGPTGGDEPQGRYSGVSRDGRSRDSRRRDNVKTAKRGSAALERGQRVTSLRQNLDGVRRNLGGCVLVDDDSLEIAPLALEHAQQQKQRHRDEADDETPP